MKASSSWDKNILVMERRTLPKMCFQDLWRKIIPQRVHVLQCCFAFLTQEKIGLENSLLESRAWKWQQEPLMLPCGTAFGGSDLDKAARMCVLPLLREKPMVFIAQLSLRTKQSDLHPSSAQLWELTLRKFSSTFRSLSSEANETTA